MHDARFLVFERRKEKLAFRDSFFLVYVTTVWPAAFSDDFPTEVIGWEVGSPTTVLYVRTGVPVITVGTIVRTKIVQTWS